MGSSFSVLDDQVDGWSYVKLLDKGATGWIHLWREEATEKLVAIKVSVCSAEEMGTKYLAYWEKEIDMLKQINHPNIVSTVALPPSLITALKCSVPPLATEYCTGGNLRRILNSTDNIRGFSESDIRECLHDLTQAIKFLHDIPIIHRDLKPENIVIQRSSGRNIYKLIDLGYAKQLAEVDEVLTSYVGTPIYLAPEIFSKREYDYTVDYWSFGVLAFEIITGFRPFFHGGPIRKWLEFIRQKKNDVIFMQNHLNKLRSSTSLPDHCRINVLFKKDLNEWFQLVLASNPEDRKSTPFTALDIMLTILDKSTLQIFDCLHATTLSLDADFTPANITKLTKIPPQSQLIIHADGHRVSSKHSLHEVIAVANIRNPVVYLFQTDGDYSLHIENNAQPPNDILQSLCSVMPYREMYLLYMKLFFRVRSEYTRSQRILCAYQALRSYLSFRSKSLQDKFDALMSAYRSLKSGVATLKEEEVRLFKYRMCSIRAMCVSLNKELLDLSGSNSDIIESIPRTSYNQVYRHFSVLRHTDLEDRNVHRSNKEMVHAVNEFYNTSSRLLPVLSSKITEALNFVRHANEISLKLTLLVNLPASKRHNKAKYTKLNQVLARNGLKSLYTDLQLWIAEVTQFDFHSSWKSRVIW